MAVLPIIVAPDPILHKKSLRVEVFDDVLRLFVSNMLETMYHDRGVGLAAVQVGVLKRILVTDLQDDDDDLSRPKGFFPLVVINPEIISTSDTKCIAREGCLSLPGQYPEVARAECVTVKFMDASGIEHVLECKGWFARCMLHEMDHLDGKLSIDYVSRLKRDVMLRKLAKIKYRSM